MPPRKTPLISCDYTPLRFFVCNLCASAPSTEQTKTGHSEPVTGGSVEWDDHGCVICSVCKLGAVAPSVTTARTGICGHCREKAHAVAEHKNHEPGSFTDCLQCEAIAHKLALSPSASRSTPYLASQFLERAAEHDGPIYRTLPDGTRRPPPGESAAVADRLALTILSNFTPLGKLFALATTWDIEVGNHRLSNCSGVCLGLAAPGLTAFVCYQHGDGFDIGVLKPTEVVSGASAGNPMRNGLRLEPGTALIVYGGAAVGVAGWVKGRPILLYAPEGLEVCEGSCSSSRSALVQAIHERFSERVR